MVHADGAGLMVRLLAVAVLLWSMAASAVAQETTADSLRLHLYEGPLADGRAAMEARDDATAAFGLGLFTVLEGVERLAQRLYAHGFDPEGGIAVSPFFGMPAGDDDVARTVEPLTYGTLRGYLETFSADMDAALPLLSAAGEGDFAVEIDVSRIRIDIDGDGVASEAESVGAPGWDSGSIWVQNWRPVRRYPKRFSRSMALTRSGWRDIRRYWPRRRISCSPMILKPSSKRVSIACFPARGCRWSARANGVRCSWIATPMRCSPMRLP
jgi:hypothetical protein